VVSQILAVLINHERQKDVLRRITLPQPPLEARRHGHCTISGATSTGMREFFNRPILNQVWGGIGLLGRFRLKIRFIDLAHGTSFSQ
jgi:hypothetical protein